MFPQKVELQYHSLHYNICSFFSLYMYWHLSFFLGNCQTSYCVTTSICKIRDRFALFILACQVYVTREPRRFNCGSHPNTEESQSMWQFLPTVRLYRGLHCCVRSYQVCLLISHTGSHSSDLQSKGIFNQFHFLVRFCLVSEHRHTLG